MNSTVNAKPIQFDLASSDAWDSLIPFLLAGKHVVLCTHENSDCDGLGSESALYEVLVNLGKQVTIINPTKVFENYHIIPHVKDSLCFDSQNLEHLQVLKDADLFILLDANNLDRTKAMRSYIEYQHTFGSMKVLCIDHHLNPSMSANIMICDASATAAGELVYGLIKAIEKKLQKKFINKDVATALYAAIMTDTASFRLPKVSPRVHMIVADLIQTGASPYDIYSAIYFNLTKSVLNLISVGSRSIRFSSQDRIAYLVITQKILNETGAKIFDTERLFEYLVGIPSVLVAMLFVQTGMFHTKLSLRSKGSIDISKIAQHYSGGGHRNAAGCRVEMKPYDFLDDALEKVQSLIENSSK